MKIVMTLLVRDEVDIVRINLDFHLAQGVDYFIIMDHLSVDGTQQILQEYVNAGVAEVFRQTSPAYYQGKWVTWMARRAFTHYAAEWVINNDADEFWWPTTGDLKSTLSTLQKQHQCVSVGRSNFPPILETHGRFIDEMVFRELKSLNCLGDPLPDKVCSVGNPDVEVTQGNHTLGGNSDVIMHKTTDLEIFHFPLRSFEQFERKIENGGAAYQNSTDLPLGIGRTWRELYKTHNQGGLRQYYLSQCLKPEDTAKGIADRKLVVDHRLRDFMESPGINSPVNVLNNR